MIRSAACPAIVRERLKPPAPVVGHAPGEKPQAAERHDTPYAVVLFNDDLNGFPFVVRVLASVLGLSSLKAWALAVRVHFAGRGVIWSGARWLAEERAAQIRAFGPDPHGKPGAQPLQAEAEPL